MGRGRGAGGFQPAALMAQERGLLLRTGHRDPEIVIPIEPERRARQIGQHGLDRAVIQRNAMDVVERLGFDPVG